MSPRAFWWLSGGLCFLLSSGCFHQTGVSRVTQRALSSTSPATERYIVQLQPHARFAELAKNIAGFPAQPDIEYTTVFDGFAASLTPQQVQALRQSKSVLRVVPDQRLKFTWESPQPMTFRITPNERERPTGIDRIDAESQRINCAAVGIAIVDTGLWKKHQDLNIAGGYNCLVGQDAAEWDDEDGHGTRVAEVAAANAENNLGVRGVASQARLFGVKVVAKQSQPHTWLSALLGAIDWISQQAQKKQIQLANLSLQIYGSEVPLLNEAIDRSIRAYNVTYIVAAGNEGVDARKNVLTHHPEVIVVSAMADTDGKCGSSGKETSRGEKDDSFAADSNFGSLITLAAPGVDILTTGPGGDYQHGRKTSGTSMSAPHVTGVAALYILKYRQEHAGQNPTPQQIKAALRQHAVPQSRSCAAPPSGDGGFSGDQDNAPEPLLYARPLLPALTPTRRPLAPHRARP